MKTKIKEALKQEYKNLGLADEVFERVASSVETFITAEDQIPNFVKGAADLLKSYQSNADKIRADLAAEKKAKEELQAQLDELKKNPPTNTEGNDPEKLAATIQAAVAAAVQPLQDKLSSFESASAIEKAVKQAKDGFFANDYVKKYTQEANDAWERAKEIYEAGGNKLTTEELTNKAMGYFSAAVSRIGVDTSKPFQSTGDPDTVTDWGSEKARLQAEGKLPKDN